MATILDGVWIDNWIYWITNQLRTIYSVYTLQLSTTESLLFLWRLRLQLCNHRCNQLLWHPLPSLTHPQAKSKSHYDRRPVSQCILVSSPKSKSHYDRRPVGQCILVSSPIWGSWPDINYCLTVTVLSISGAPSGERSGLSFVLVTWTASVQ
jgi:hypothetical protein